MLLFTVTITRWPYVYNFDINVSRLFTLKFDFVDFEGERVTVASFVTGFFENYTNGPKRGLNDECLLSDNGHLLTRNKPVNKKKRLRIIRDTKKSVKSDKEKSIIRVNLRKTLHILRCDKMLSLSIARR